MRAILGTWLAVFLLAAPAALAQEVQAKSFPPTVYSVASAPALVGILLRQDYRARFETLDDGRWRVLARTPDGRDFAIDLHKCSGPHACEDVRLWKAWDLPEGTGLEAINEWNRANRFAKAWLAETGEAVLELDYDFAGGVFQDNFLSTLDIWANAIADFESRIGR